MQPMAPASPRRGATADQHHHSGQGFFPHSPPPRSSASPPDAHAHQLRPGGSFAMPLSPAQVQQQPGRFPGGGDAAATPGVANWSFCGSVSGATRLDHLSSPGNSGVIIPRMPHSPQPPPPPPPRSSASPPDAHAHQLRPGGSFTMPLSPAQVQQQHPGRFPGGDAGTPGVANWSFCGSVSGATRLDHLSSPGNVNTGGVISRMPSLGTTDFAHAVAPPPQNRVSTSAEPDHRHHQHHQQQQQRTPLTSPTAAAAGGSVASGGFATTRAYRPHAQSAAVVPQSHGTKVSPSSPHPHATSRVAHGGAQFRSAP